jgi:hypothetical protein
MTKLIFVLSFLIISVSTGIAQFAPPAGQAGTTAVHKDSIAIVSWANAVVQFNRGASDIANGWGTLTSFGTADEALGYAQGNSVDVVSLGDSGSITVSFPFPIMNGPGNDFAVFENSFSDSYLEFAFVEVSSDGLNFVRFPSTSLTSAAVQTGTYQNSNTELVHNLAGKYEQGYGTPFDLEDLIDSAGINLDSIRYVRIVDVIGTIDPMYASYDADGNIVNDPYPSDFEAGGFDLDAIGVINENNIYANIDAENEIDFSVYPNPSNGNFTIKSELEEFEISIYDAAGKLVFYEGDGETDELNLSSILQPGIYTIVITTNIERGSQKLILL